MPTDEVPAEMAAALNQNAIVLPGSIGGLPYFLVAGTPQLEQAGIPGQGGNVLLGQASIAMIPGLGPNPEGVWSRSGGSGSVGVKESNESVALHRGGDGTRGYASDFAPIAFAFGVVL